MAHYDAIVLGVGGVGSAALYHLARRGARALGIERYAPGHDRGSSHGQSRLIRQAYYEHPDYVPLVQRAFELWCEMEQESGQSLYREVGLLQVGPREGEVLSGVRASARRHALPIDELTRSEAQVRFPAFRIPDACEAIFEQRAGYLHVERAVRVHAEQAVQLGAQLRTGETIRSWRVEGPSVVVETDQDTYQADRLIVTAGAWAGQLLTDLGIPLEVRRKPLYWFRTTSDAYRPESGCPGFLFDLPQGTFYGVPQLDAAGVKVAEHTGGHVVRDPLTVERAVDTEDERRVAAFVGEHLPAATTQCTDHTVCMYTMTPDAHFVVDSHPLHPAVCFAAGLSGHGFKFTCVLGETLVQLALDGQTPLPIGFLTSKRFAVQH